jgi:hypothetical protein
MQIKRLTDLEDLKRYQQGYREATGFDVKLERLERYTVYAALRGDDIFAGFWIIEEPPFRMLEFIPDAYVDHDAVIEEVLGEKLVEFGGLWKRRGSTPGWKRIQWFLVSCLKAVGHVPGDGLVGFGYDHNVDHLRRLYSHANTRVLYRGPVSVPSFDGEPQTLHASVECMKRGAFAKATVSLVLELTGQAAKNLTKAPFSWRKGEDEVATKDLPSWLPRRDLTRALREGFK